MLKPKNAFFTTCNVLAKVHVQKNDVIGVIVHQERNLLWIFFNDYIFGTKTIDYNKYYGYAGIEVVKVANEDLKLGVSTKDNGGKLVISRVNRATPAYKDGLNVNDEILAINGYRIASSKDLTSAIDRAKKGDKLKFTVVRDGRLENLEITMKPTEGKFDFSFKVSDKKTKEQKVVYDKWLTTK